MNEFFSDEIAQVEKTAEVEWADVEKQADSLFNVWVGHPEKKWAKVAWEKLRDASLTSHKDYADYYTVLLRFMTLAAIYHDFCEVAFDECSIDREDIYHWLEKMDMDEKIIWQLYGRSPDRDVTNEVDIKEALTELMKEQHHDIIIGLNEGFGGDNQLYESLAKSKELDEDEEEVENNSDLEKKKREINEEMSGIMECLTKRHGANISLVGQHIHYRDGNRLSLDELSKLKDKYPGHAVDELEGLLVEKLDELEELKNDKNDRDIWEVSSGNAEAYSWIDQGCQPLHW